MSFTCDDLTGNEYGRLAHLIKGDPMKALLSTDSTKSAQAIAGLCLIQDQRNGTALPYADYLELTMAELQQRLGLFEDLEAQVANMLTRLDTEPTAAGLDDDNEEPAAPQTMADLAVEAVDDVVEEAGAVDPSDPPASPSSGG